MIREITIKADGKEYTLRLGNNAICRFEAEARITVIKFSQLAGSGDMEMRFIRALLWAGLKQYHPEMTLDMTGDLIDAIGLDHAGDYVRQALESAYPAPTGDENPPMAIRHGIGNGS